MLLVEEQEIVGLVRGELLHGVDNAVVFVVLEGAFSFSAYFENVASLGNKLKIHNTLRRICERVSCGSTRYCTLLLMYMIPMCLGIFEARGACAGAEALFAQFVVWVVSIFLKMQLRPVPLNTARTQNLINPLIHKP